MSQASAPESGTPPLETPEEARMARARLPEGLRPETLAVRTALAPSQPGENSEALFLTSAYVQPDSETSARRFAEMEDFTYARTSNPTVRNASCSSCSTSSAAPASRSSMRLSAWSGRADGCSSLRT